VITLHSCRETIIDVTYAAEVGLVDLKDLPGRNRNELASGRSEH